MTFKITEYDVGRTAVTRSGERVVINGWDGSRGAKVCVSGDWLFTNGKFVENIELGHDLVAWADEQDQEKPDSKEQVPSGVSGLALRDCPELISISRVANGWVVQASPVDGQPIRDRVALTQSGLLDVIRKLTGDE